MPAIKRLIIYAEAWNVTAEIIEAVSSTILKVKNNIINNTRLKIYIVCYINLLLVVTTKELLVIILIRS